MTTHFPAPSTFPTLSFYHELPNIAKGKSLFVIVGIA